MNYFGELTLRLVAGAMHLPEDFRQRHAEFLLSLQTADGGFPGREGEADPYYTSFALRALILLGLLDEEAAQRSSTFLSSCLLEDRLPSSVDFMAVVYSDALLSVSFDCSPFASAGLDTREEVRRRTDQFRKKDGGYAKTLKSGLSSTYHSFLAVACRQLADVAEDDPEATVAMLKSRQREDGGFVELPPLKEGGTNPTAAAIGALRLLDPSREHDGVFHAATEFLLKMQTPDGGFRANTRIPLGDLLSTFTTVVALHDLGALERLDRKTAESFASHMEFSEGGFRGGAWDKEPDAEYTFYGVGALAMLASQDVEGLASGFSFPKIV